MPLSPHEVDLFERSRARLEAIAYRLLGSAGDAEDAVQDTFLRWQAADRDRVETPETWLTKVLTNVCLNQLTSARARRETYVGTWLPAVASATGSPARRNGTCAASSTGSASPCTSTPTSPGSSRPARSPATAGRSRPR